MGNVTCGSCGQPVRNEDTQCAFCGAQRSAWSSMPAHGQPRAQRRSLGLVIVVALIGLMAALGAAVATVLLAH